MLFETWQKPKKGPFFCTSVYIKYYITNFTLRLDWFYQTVCGLEYLHKMKVLHRDLKPSNIFLKSSCGCVTGCQRTSVKIGDFGVSTVLRRDSDYKTATSIGTPYYLSPEICHGWSRIMKLRNLKIWRFHQRWQALLMISNRTSGLLVACCMKCWQINRPFWRRKSKGWFRKLRAESCQFYPTMRTQCLPTWCPNFSTSGLKQDRVPLS